MLFGDFGHRVGNGGGIRTEHRIDPVLRDNLVVGADGRLLIRGIVLDHELDRTETCKVSSRSSVSCERPYHSIT